ncbi:MAG: ferredoxin [Deltaproteobacteria bacterium]|jgi:ferredoxin|nr:ferredoxin [Deltaproteobacteria bacterium]MBW2386598.1 ferredoxin [Deltaproteobacteria bacterium]
MSGGGKLKVEHDSNACVGHGRCYVLAPDVFDEDERGHGVVKQASVHAELAKQARLAAENCPEDAITLRSDDDA